MKQRARHDAPYWCEENVWHLCDDPQLGPGDREVVVVSNGARQVAMWCQRAALQPDDPVIWDYHVLMCARGPEGWLAWDLDTTLAWPCEMGGYLDSTFRAVPPRLAPRFRVISAATYRRDFASDRRHMRDSVGLYSQTPPPWPPIGTEHTLPDLLAIHDGQWGPWIDLAVLRTRFAQKSTSDPP